MIKVVKSKKLYRLEDPKIKSKLFVPGNKFTIDDNYFANIAYHYNHGNGIFRDEHTIQCYRSYIDEYLSEEHTMEELIEFKNKMLPMLINYDRARIEFIMDLYRFNHNLDVIPRVRSLICSDEKSLDHWIKVLGSDREVYELNFNGRYTKSRESLRPFLGDSPKEIEEFAKLYYENNSRKADHNVNDYEYLTQGEYKVVRRVN